MLIVRQMAQPPVQALVVVLDQGRERRAVAALGLADQHVFIGCRHSSHRCFHAVKTPPALKRWRKKQKSALFNLGCYQVTFCRTAFPGRPPRHGRPGKAVHLDTDGLGRPSTSTRTAWEGRPPRHGRPGKAVHLDTDGLGRPSTSTRTAWEGRPTKLVPLYEKMPKNHCQPLPLFTSHCYLRYRACFVNKCTVLFIQTRSTNPQPIARLDAS